MTKDGVSFSVLHQQRKMQAAANSGAASTPSLSTANAAVSDAATREQRFYRNKLLPPINQTMITPPLGSVGYQPVQGMCVVFGV